MEEQDFLQNFSLYTEEENHTRPPRARISESEIKNRCNEAKNKKLEKEKERFNQFIRENYVSNHTLDLPFNNLATCPIWGRHGGVSWPVWLRRTSKKLQISKKRFRALLLKFCAEEDEHEVVFDTLNERLYYHPYVLRCMYAISLNPAITHVTIRDTRLEGCSCDAIKHMLRNTTSITHLRIYFPFTSISVEDVCNMFLFAKTLEYVEMNASEGHRLIKKGNKCFTHHGVKGYCVVCKNNRSQLRKELLQNNKQLVVLKGNLLADI